ncbi:MAG: helix-turn-helix domain-containing protein [Thaumarchaeota archaeon]|nr:helix-turn-helix domain-containing protein [Nitrososphaerota archaeon]
MSINVQDLSVDTRYRLFEALSHPTRARILKLVAEKELAFSALKRELGLESSGQLQHHLQKLSGFIELENQSGSYVLTDMGRRALEVYYLSERSGSSLESICCLPVATEASRARRVGRAGTALRLSIAGVLLAITIAFIDSSFTTGNSTLGLSGPSYFIGLGLSGAIVAGFFGISFLIAGMQGYPGCEVMAVPNAVSREQRYYCACLITPFNLPRGRFLKPLP